MSIKTTPTTEISLSTTEVVADAATEIKASGEHLVKTEKLETVKAIRKEYSIVGDAFYAGINSDQAPWWLNDLVDSTVNGAVKAGFSNYDELTQDVRDAIDSIDIAKNTFVQSIDFTDRVNGIVGSKLDTLNATYDGKFATIVGLNLVEANTDFAITQRINDLRASFSADINSRITNVQNAFSDADQSLADDITVLTTAFLDQEKNLSGTANAVSGLQNFVGIDPESALPNGLGMLSRLNVLEKQTDGVIEYTTGTYDVMEGIEDPNTNTDNDHLRVDALPYVLWTHLKGTGAPTSTTRPYTNYSLETPAEERANVLENTIYIRQDYTNSDEDRYYLFVAGAWESITEAVFQRERLSLRSAHTADVYIQYSVSPDGVKTYNRGYKFIKTAPDTTSPYSTDSDGFGWAIILDTDTQNAYMAALNAQDLADSKRRVFVDTPFPPYDEGDLWVDTSGSVSVVKVSQNTIGVNGVYTATHWVLADEYAKNFVENTYEPDSAQLHRQLDGKLEYYFYEDFNDVSGATDESSALAIVSGAWDTVELRDTHNGDVIYFKNTKNAFWYQASTGSWLAVDDTSMYQALQDAAAAQASADGKVSSFYAWGDMEGGLPPSSYTAPAKDATYKTDESNNYLDSAGNITTNPEEYVEEPAGPAEVVSADNVTMWFTGGTLYKKGTTWENKVPVPTISGNGTYISEGDVLTVFDPILGDTENYQYVNGVWVINGPTGIISKSKWFVDLDNAVNGKNGLLAASLSNLSVTGEAYTDGKVSGVENKFRYDSNIMLDGKLYESGFGLSSEGVSQEGRDGNTNETAFDSEFWVNAKRFVLKSPDHPGVEARFTVTGSGISLGVEHTEATKNVPAGAYSSGGRYEAGDIVTHNGTSYMAIKDVPLNTAVGNTAYWQLLAGKGDSGKGIDFWFKRSTLAPTDTPSTAGVDANGWYTDLSNPSLSGAGDLYTVKGTKLEGSNVWSFSEPTIHIKKYLRELTIYSAPTTGTVSAPARSFYNFDSDKLTIGSNANGWTSSLKNIQSNHQKIYVTTALVSGNSTETAVPITWSGPTVYAQRTDGISPDALTVDVKTSSTATTLDFSDGSSATISNGADGESSGVVIVYADDESGTNASFTQGTRRYANYYEWTGTAPTSVPSGLTFTLFVGTDGDSAGVLPIYADDVLGANATFTYSGQEFVNFYDWTVKAPTSVPPDLTYVRFIGIHYTGTTEYYKLTNSATAPTVASGSWSTSPQSPTASNKYLWNYNKNTKSDGSYTNSPVTLITSYVKDGKEGNGIASITEEYQLGSSPTTAPTGTWSSTFSGAGTISNALPYMWNRTTIAYTLSAPKVTTTLIAAKGTKGDNGSNGPKGADGKRGGERETIGTSTGVWYDSVAESAMPNGIAVLNDIVTIYKLSDPSVETTKRFNGSSWQPYTLRVHGSALIEDTLDAKVIRAGTYLDSPAINYNPDTGVRNNNFSTDPQGNMFAKSATLQAVTIKDSSGNVVMSSSGAIPSYKVTGLGSLATKNGISYNELSGRPNFGAFAFLSSLGYDDLSGKPTLGSLASKNSLSYNEVTGKPALGSLAYLNSIAYDNVTGKPSLGPFAGLSKILSSNVTTYIANGAIGSAQINQAYINQLFGQNASFYGTVYAQNLDGDVTDSKVKTPSDTPLSYRENRKIVSFAVASQPFARTVTLSPVMVEDRDRYNDAYGDKLRVTVYFYKGSTLIKSFKIKVGSETSGTTPMVASHLGSGESATFSVNVKDESTYAQDKFIHVISPVIISVFKDGSTIT